MTASALIKMPRPWLSRRRVASPGSGKSEETLRRSLVSALAIQFDELKRVRVERVNAADSGLYLWENDAANCCMNTMHDGNLSPPPPTHTHTHTHTPPLKHVTATTSTNMNKLIVCMLRKNR